MTAEVPDSVERRMSPYGQNPFNSYATSPVFRPERPNCKAGGRWWVRVFDVHRWQRNSGLIWVTSILTVSLLSPKIWNSRAPYRCLDQLCNRERTCRSVGVWSFGAQNSLVYKFSWPIGELDHAMLKFNEPRRIRPVSSTIWHFTYTCSSRVRVPFQAQWLCPTNDS